MKLKKKVKKRIFILIIIALFILLGFLLYQNFKPKEKKVQEAKIVSKIDKYGYKLKDNKPSKYKSLFKELEELLKAEEVDEEKYVSKIAELFIYDFYSLEDKEAKTDIGGVDFVYPSVLENFLQNAQNTYYKYVESNIYKNRNQKLPVVNNIEITSIEKTPFAYGEQNDENAYKIVASWDYTSTDFSGYQKQATLIFVHDGNKLSLVELQ
jgi:hypothetical protein